MRPLFICRQFSLAAHGAESQTALLARQIGRMGHHARVAAGRLDASWAQNEVIDGLEVVRLASPRKRLVGTWQYLRALKHYLLDERAHYDIIHVMFAKHSAALAGRMSRRLNRPVVCKPACAGEYGDLQAVWRTAFPRRTLAGIMRVDRLIAISDEIATEWVGAGFPIERIVRLPNGVDTQRFRPAAAGEREEARRKFGLPAQAIVIAGAGRLERQKGFELLIEAVGRLGDASSIHVAIAGEGSRRDELARLAESIGIAPRLHLLGRIKSIEEVYRAADLFVLPSRGEGLSNALLEAMASGLDVAATRVSGVTELVRDGQTGLLAAPESSQSLADVLRRWLQGPPGRYGPSAREHIERGYSIRSVAQRTIDLYQELIAERAPNPNA